jgi:putative ABC transport system substrate-binding protein
MIAEILARTISVLLINGPAALKAAYSATKNLPLIVIDLETDPVVAGYAQSIARPGGNVSGVFLDFPNFAGKWIELLGEFVPKLSRLAVMWDPATGPVQPDALKGTATTLSIQLDVLEVKVRSDFTGAFAVAKDRGAGAVIMTSSPLVPASVKDLAELSLRYKLPAITMFSEFPRTGGLFSYGPNLLGSVRQMGTMAGKVLLGTAPANLPIERPSKFELIVNLHAAEALGLTIPTSIQVRADEVIE